MAIAVTCHGLDRLGDYVRTVGQKLTGGCRDATHLDSTATFADSRIP